LISELSASHDFNVQTLLITDPVWRHAVSIN